MAGVTTVADDAGLQNLVSKVDHIVILMMENRSFDHMLGYLTIDRGRTDLEGLRKGLSNTANGKSWPVHKAKGTTLVKEQDPRHGHVDVEQQIAGGAMSGFAENYWSTRTQPLAHGDSPGTVMAYHTAAQLPVYDYLAANFLICDHWFCSVPGETMPNRCYAVAGTSGGRLEALSPPRPYDLNSFCRLLDAVKPNPVPWVWFSHDYVPMLWIIDPKYAAGSIPRYFDRSDILGHPSFIERAANGQLPAVSWIDPNFVDLTFGPAGSNDDHPPSDLHAGQKLALALFDAVTQGPAWEKTMVILTYDEHGGFYDHLTPPACEDDSPLLRTLGPRVPAFVISPWVPEAGVSTTVYDHTSIIKTILARFCRNPDGTVPDMGARVRAAEHLGAVLTETNARPQIPRASYQKLITKAQGWSDTLAAHPAIPTAASLRAETTVTDFQQEFLALRQATLQEKTPAGAAPTPNTQN